MSTLLPFAVGDQVFWQGQPGRVSEVVGGRVVVDYVDRHGAWFVAITTDEILRGQQNGVVQRRAQRPWPGVA